MRSKLKRPRIDGQVRLPIHPRPGRTRCSCRKLKRPDCDRAGAEGRIGQSGARRSALPTQSRDMIGQPAAIVKTVEMPASGCSRNGDRAFVRRIDRPSICRNVLARFSWPSSRKMVMEKTTSSAVTGEPSWKAASSRRRNCQVRRSCADAHALRGIGIIGSHLVGRARHQRGEGQAHSGCAVRRST